MMYKSATPLNLNRNINAWYKEKQIALIIVKVKNKTYEQSLFLKNNPDNSSKP